jgi:phage shock protein E
MSSTLTQALIALAVIGSLFYLNTPSAAPSPDAPLVAGARIHGERAKKLVAEGALLLDVRTPQEFSMGHVEGALNIPVQVINQRHKELPRDKVIVVYCRSGRRSAHAAQLLLEAGFKEVYDIGPMSAYPR